MSRTLSDKHSLSRLDDLISEFNKLNQEIQRRSKQLSDKVSRFSE